MTQPAEQAALAAEFRKLWLEGGNSEDDLTASRAVQGFAWFKYGRAHRAEAPSADNIRAAVMVALGEASLCWKPKPTGVFDSEWAINIGERLMAAIVQELWLHECSIKAEALRKDALRYRWLRNNLDGIDWAYGSPPRSVVMFRLPDDAEIGNGPALDLGIDAAIKASE